jgi:hypothetical protein
MKSSRNLNDKNDTSLLTVNLFFDIKTDLNVDKVKTLYFKATGEELDTISLKKLRKIWREKLFLGAAEILKIPKNRRNFGAKK